VKYENSLITISTDDLTVIISKEIAGYESVMSQAVNERRDTVEFINNAKSTMTMLTLAGIVQKGLTLKSVVRSEEYNKVVNDLNEERKSRAVLVARIDRMIDAVGEMVSDARGLNNNHDMTHAEKRGAWTWFFSFWGDRITQDRTWRMKDTTPDIEIPF